MTDCFIRIFVNFFNYKYHICSRSALCDVICGTFFLSLFFYRDDNISYGELFFSCALNVHNSICSWFNSWVAEAMGVKFHAQGNNSSRKAITNYATIILVQDKQPFYTVLVPNVMVISISE